MNLTRCDKCGTEVPSQKGFVVLLPAIANIEASRHIGSGRKDACSLVCAIALLRDEADHISAGAVVA